MHRTANQVEYLCKHLSISQGRPPRARPRPRARAQSAPLGLGLGLGLGHRAAPLGLGLGLGLGHRAAPLGLGSWGPPHEHPSAPLGHSPNACSVISLNFCLATASVVLLICQLRKLTLPRKKIPSAKKVKTTSLSLDLTRLSPSAPHRYP